MALNKPPPSIPMTRQGNLPAVNYIVTYGPKPQHAICPHCSADVKTSTSLTTATKTHAMALLLSLCFPCCCCCPYFISSCKNTDHYCPSCKTYLGTYKY